MRAVHPVVPAVVLMFALALPAVADAKPKPPPPPPDSAADCTFEAVADVPDYIVLASINVGVRCATSKRTIVVSARMTRDGVVTPVLPLGTADYTCSNTTTCLVSYDLFSIDAVTMPVPGNQRYCAGGTGLVGGVVLGPREACEDDARL